MIGQPPPVLSPRQMSLLRIVLALAWADGTLAREEVDVMITRFSHAFAPNPQQRPHFETELRSYLVQDIPMGEVVPLLETTAEKEFVLRVGYKVISASARTPDEAPINQAESEAYQHLVSLLGLPADAVQRIEREAGETLTSARHNVSDLLVYQVRDYLRQ
ncbi:MAG: TerB family tellurite resistance protein [Cyanobacteria bacterium P01_A01_bin.105]